MAHQQQRWQRCGLWHTAATGNRPMLQCSRQLPAGGIELRRIRCERRAHRHPGCMEPGIAAASSAPAAAWGTAGWQCSSDSCSSACRGCDGDCSGVWRHAPSERRCQRPARCSVVMNSHFQSGFNALQGSFASSAREEDCGCSRGALFQQRRSGAFRCLLLCHHWRQAARSRPKVVCDAYRSSFVSHLMPERPGGVPRMSGCPSRSVPQFLDPHATQHKCRQTCSLPPLYPSIPVSGQSSLRPLLLCPSPSASTGLKNGRPPLP